MGGCHCLVSTHDDILSCVFIFSMMFTTFLTSCLLLTKIHPALSGTVTTNSNSQLEYSDNAGVYNDELPGDIPDNVQVIKLIGNQLTSLETCPVLELLLELDLTDNKLATFPNLLNASSILRFLYLKGNSISYVDSERLDLLVRIEVSTTKYQ